VIGGLRFSYREDEGAHYEQTEINERFSNGVLVGSVVIESQKYYFVSVQKNDGPTGGLVATFDPTLDLGVTVRLLLKLFTKQVPYDQFVQWLAENTDQMWSLKEN